MSTSANEQITAIKNQFTELFEIFEQNLNGKSKLKAHNYRKTAIKRFKDLSLPTRKDEDWKYTSVARIVEPKYQIGIPFEVTTAQLDNYKFGNLDTNILVFTNGIFQEDLSNLPSNDGKIVLLPLDQAIQEETYATIVQKQLEQPASEPMGTFAALNEAFATHGIFIHVKKGANELPPIHLLYLTDTEAEILISPRVVIHVEDNSECTVIESFHALSEKPYFINSMNNFGVGANSHLHHYKIQLDSQAAFRINDTVVRQARDSTYSNYTVDLGGKIVRNNLSSMLKDTGTMTNFYGLYLPGESQHIDNQTFIDHAHPHCNSNELYKGIIKDRARGVFNGKVMVRQDAQKTNAYQQNSTLVLSDRAVMDTKPQLEIYADDVRCSHGATVGQLDETAVYYLKARGLDDAKARAMLQHAFITEVIEKMPLEQVRDKVDEWVTAKLRK